MAARIVHRYSDEGLLVKALGYKENFTGAWQACEGMRRHAAACGRARAPLVGPRPPFPGAAWRHWPMANGQTADTVLADWGGPRDGIIPCFGVPAPITHLLFQGSWSTLVLRRSWPLARAAFPEECWASLPDDPLQFSFVGATTDATPDTFLELAGRVRDWAPTPLEAAERAEGPAGAADERMALEGAM